MNIDQNVMVQFVQLVEKYPMLYNPSAAGYLDCHLVDSVWQQIAQMINEPVTVCKERWKNVRSSYARWLREEGKTNTGRRKKPYYLARYLHFLDGNRKPKIANVASGEGVTAEVFIKEEDDNLSEEKEKDTPEECTVTPDSLPQTTWMTRMHKTEYPDESFRWVDADACYSSRKRPIDIDSDDEVEDRKKKKESCDLMFFKSVIPKIEPLTVKQKIELQVLILQKILEYTADNESKETVTADVQS